MIEKNVIEAIIQLIEDKIMMASPVFVFDYSEGTYTDVTDEASNDSDNFTVLRNDNDALFIGAGYKFASVYLTVDSVVGAYGTWEYRRESDGNWVTIPGVVDGTNQLTQSGEVTFTPPSDWIPAVLNGVDGFYIRWVNETGNDYASGTLTQIEMSYGSLNGNVIVSEPPYNVEDAIASNYLILVEHLTSPSTIGSRLRKYREVLQVSARAVTATDIHMLRKQLEGVFYYYYQDAGNGIAYIKPGNAKEFRDQNTTLDSDILVYAVELMVQHYRAYNIPT